MSKKFLILCISAICFSVIFSCKNNDSKTEETTTVEAPVVIAPSFSADTAYDYVKKQVSFGPRVPGTAASKKCGDYLIKEFKAYGMEITEQPFIATLFNGKTVASRNIIAAYNPKATKRIIIASHWDSRPFADKDLTNKTKAIDGANDGASGVGVMLEIARIISKDSLKIGIDFVLFDTEDWGAPNDYSAEVKHEYGGYCLGSEYWSKNLHKPGYSAFYGILLDMVGAPNAQFRKDMLSMQVGPSIVNNIWSVGASLGFANIFKNEDGGGITDDHVPVNTYAKIPMIDIIDTRPNSNTFFEHHHTTKDNMDAIDKNTLKAVGQTLMQVLYMENTAL